jgi:hypothetical protein
MRSWSQPTESTCGLECSGEVKRLRLWSWAVLKSQSFPFSIAESIYVHFDPFINQKEALVLPLFSY